MDFQLLKVKVMFDNHPFSKSLIQQFVKILIKMLVIVFVIDPVLAVYISVQQYFTGILWMAAI